MKHQKFKWIIFILLIGLFVSAFLHLHKDKTLDKHEKCSICQVRANIISNAVKVDLNKISLLIHKIHSKKETVTQINSDHQKPSRAPPFISI